MVTKVKKEHILVIEVFDPVDGGNRCFRNCSLLRMSHAITAKFFLSYFLEKGTNLLNLESSKVQYNINNATTNFKKRYTGMFQGEF
jgi:hypothetical protein